MKKLLIFILMALSALPTMALAVDVGDYALPDRVAIGIPDIVNAILRIIWAFVVLGVVVLFIVAGFLFVNAQGDPRKISQARLAVAWGVVGVVVIVISYSIIRIITSQIT